MRIDQQLTQLISARNRPDILRLDISEVRGVDGVYGIRNWSDLSVNLNRLLEQGWFKRMHAAEHERLMVFLDTHSHEQRPVSTLDQLVEIQQCIELLSATIPTVIDILSSVSPEANPDAIFVYLGDIQTLDEFEDVVSDLKRLFDLMSIGGGFTFNGVARGSDWISVIPWGAVAGVAYHITLHLVSKYLRVREEKSENEARVELETIKDMTGSDTQVQNDEIRDYLDRLTVAKMREDWAEVQRYLGDAATTAGEANEGRNKLEQAVRMMSEQIEKGRGFHPALATPPNIIVSGDNNHITINYVAPSQDTPALEPPQEERDGAE